MKKLLLTLVGAGVLLGAVSASAGPEEDRKAMVNYFKQKFPDVKFENYIHGALALDADSKAQYDSIMEFPPYEGVVEQGKKMWETPFKNGKKYADCFPNGGKNAAAMYPMFDDKKGEVVIFDEALNNCRVANGEEPYKLDDVKTMGTLLSYARTLSDGAKVNVKVNGPAALAAYEDGKHTFYSRAGQLNLACANCHVQNAGVRLRSELLSPALGHTTHWPVFRGGDNLVTLQMRYKGCHNSVRHVPDNVGSKRYKNLEFFESYMSNGLEMKASVFRK
ncbi:diheme cytochrome SoxA (sulfur oxidation) [Sulfuritortus calidifontis]|uniref:SoxAX cytochrome complex subunit A n=1 Tax=Sulfuritortus calidifontis TaxID=1914471 RepID=A0A4R3JZT9_9PROT|nr:sulfur oxidation c-type cytochrome SoxA [Sulfuritortus calidifontis]TCS73099.1 diheme cytochrome SoxA (sulfur oxidation) [Sulfuritortus calidifontis]